MRCQAITSCVTAVVLAHRAAVCIAQHVCCEDAGEPCTCTIGQSPPPPTIGVLTSNKENELPIADASAAKRKAAEDALKARANKERLQQMFAKAAGDTLHLTAADSALVGACATWVS